MAQAEAGAPLRVAVPQLPAVRPGGDRVPLQLCWGLGNVLHVFVPGQAGAPGPFGAQREGAESSSSLLALSWADTSAPARRIAALSAPLFAELQEQQQQSPSQRDRWEQMVSWSHKVSQGVLRPNATVQGAGPGPEAHQRMAHMVWDLLRISFLFSSSAAPAFIPAGPPLAHWLKKHSACISWQEGSTVERLTLLQKQLQRNQVAPPEEFPDYWSVVASCAALGWTKEAVTLLRLHSSYRTLQLREREAENGLVEAVATLMSEMPALMSDMPSLGGGGPVGRQGQNGAGPEGARGEWWGPGGEDQDLCVISPTEMHQFLQARERWRGRLSKLCDATEFWAQCRGVGTERGLRWLIGVLLGSGECLRAALGGHFVESLVAELLHKHPQAGLDAVPDLAQRVRLTASARGGSGGGEAGVSRQDRLLMAVLQRETEEVLSQCSKLFDSWMMCHATEVLSFGRRDLLPAAGAPPAASWPLLTTYRLNYALELLTHPATWQMALVYMAPTTPALPLLETVLTWQALQPHSSEQRQLQTILGLAASYGATSCTKAISKAMAVRCAEGGRLLYALQWLSRAHCPPLSAQLVHRLLAAWDDAASTEAGPEGAAAAIVAWGQGRAGKDLEAAVQEDPRALKGRTGGSTGVPRVDSDLGADAAVQTLVRLWCAHGDLQALQRLPAGQARAPTAAESAALQSLKDNLALALECAARFPTLFLGLLQLAVAVLQRGGQRLLELDDVGRLMAHLEQTVATTRDLPQCYSPQSLLHLRAALNAHYASIQIFN